jgi:molybdopterin-guanine dinucleotide biosynthesis protein A
VSAPQIGILVGGAGSRMGGAAKGLLTAPSGEPLVARLIDVCRAACPEAELCLVGAHDAYRELELRTLADDPAGCGPIGGLRALLADARARNAGLALAIACDLPFLSAGIVRRLAAVSGPGAAWVPRVGAHLQPLAAAYEPAACCAALDAVLARGKRSLLSVLDELGPRVEELTLDAADELALRDWDTPDDVARG